MNSGGAARTAEPAPTQAATRRLGRGAAVLSVGIATAGIFSYVFFAISAHLLSKSDYGGITLLWSAVFIIVSVFYRPVEQLLSRSIAEQQALGQRGLAPLRVASFIQLVLGGLFAVGALIFRGPVEDGLFSGDSTLYWIMVVAVLAYAASYFARGYLAGQRRFGLYGALVGMESTSRLMFAIALLLGITSSRNSVAVGMAAAPLISLTVVPWAIGRHARRTGLATDAESGGSLRDQSSRQPAGDGQETALERQERRAAGSGHGQKTAEGEQDTAGNKEPTGDSAGIGFLQGGWFAASVLVIMFSEQTFLNAGPIAVKTTAGIQGAALAGFIFNILLIARAPLQLFQAVSTALLPHLTNARVTEGTDTFRHSVRVTILAIVAFAVVVIAVMATIGPSIMQILFSAKFDYDRLGLVVVAAGMGLYLSATTLNQATLAQGQARRAALCWLGTAVLFAAWIFSPIMEEIRRVELGYAVAAALLCGLLYLVYRGPIGRSSDMPRVGSAEEVETRLAAADQAT